MLIIPIALADCISCPLLRTQIRLHLQARLFHVLFK